MWEEEEGEDKDGRWRREKMRMEDGGGRLESTRV